MTLNPEQMFAREHSMREDDLSEKEWEVNLQFAQPYRKEEPKIDDFKQLNPDDLDRQRDKQKVADLKRRTSEMEKTERAVILEAVLAEQIERSEWMGGDAYTFQTTEFDDRINHADLVIEFGRPEGAHYLAIDVTTAQDADVRAKKRERIDQEVDAGKLTSIKYFESQADEEHPQKSLNNIPRAVIYVSPEALKRITEIQYDILEKKKGTNQKMAQDPVQLEILGQIESQMTEHVIRILHNFRDFKDVPPKFKQDLERLIDIVRRLPAPAHRAAEGFDQDEVVEIMQKILETKDEDEKGAKSLTPYRALKKISAVRRIIRSARTEKQETLEQE
ncbi:MAG: hypothetical protein HYS45_02330 [Parcubacteria group bacterium]|nr:hypothetical protein [Parcubacteria group bacterium]